MLHIGYAISLSTDLSPKLYATKQPKPNPKPHTASGPIGLCSRAPDSPRVNMASFYGVIPQRNGLEALVSSKRKCISDRIDRPPHPNPRQATRKLPQASSLVVWWDTNVFLFSVNWQTT